jgi:hypothetical protein
MDTLFYLLFAISIIVCFVAIMIGITEINKTAINIGLFAIVPTVVFLFTAFHFEEQIQEEENEQLSIENCKKDPNCKVDIIKRTCLIDNDAEPFRCRLHLP